MTLTEIIGTAGIGVMVVAISLAIHARTKAAKQRAEYDGQLLEEYPGFMVDFYMALFWSGMLMMQIANLLLHAEPGGVYRVVPLMWIATAAMVFNFGLHAGRLSMRWETRRYKAKRGAREPRA